MTEASPPLAGSPFNRVPLEITVSVGHARPLIGELAGLGRDSVLALDRRVDDPVELFVGDRLIARGTLVEIDEGGDARLAVRLTEVADLSGGV